MATSAIPTTPRVRQRTPPVDELSPPHTPTQNGVGTDYFSTKKAAQAAPVPIDMDIPDNYVQATLDRVKPLPPIDRNNWWKELNWLNVAILIMTPALSIYGAVTTKLQWNTGWFAVFWYFVTGLGITAGYHRLWAHRAYSATKPLQYVLALAGAGAVQGSIRWWSRGHRAHHRYTDTDLDPYSAHKGLVWSHIGWMVIKPRRKPGVADISDLTHNEVVRFQHKYYIQLLLTMAFVVPTAVPGLFWGDWRGGFFYAGAARLCFVHHSTFCVNSLAHWLGEAPFDDRDTPRDHWITALVTIGEGYHNFHHQFPSDFRNAIRWFQYDPTKWFIAIAKVLGLAYNLKTFPENEVQKGILTQQLKALKKAEANVAWPTSANDLPVVTWDEFQEQAKTRNLIAVGGYIHDVESFATEHPGGKHLLQKMRGKDATTAFFGGVYDHSNAAHNLLAMMRVGVLLGGAEVEHDKAEYRGMSEEEIADAIARKQASRYVPPGQRLQIIENESIKYSFKGEHSRTSTDRVWA